MRRWCARRSPASPTTSLPSRRLFKPLGIEHWWFQYYEGGEKYRPASVAWPGHARPRPGPHRLLHVAATAAGAIGRSFRNGSSRRRPRPTHDVKTPEMRWKLNPQVFSHGWELPAHCTGDRRPQRRGHPGRRPGQARLRRPVHRVCAQSRPGRHPPDRRQRRMGLRGIPAPGVPGGGRQLSAARRTRQCGVPEIAIHLRQGIFASAEAPARSMSDRICDERATKAEAKRPAARRVAPHLGSGFVAPRSQVHADMLPRRAAPEPKCGATNV